MRESPRVLSDPKEPPPWGFSFVWCWGCIRATCLQIAYKQQKTKNPATVLIAGFPLLYLVGRAGVEPTTNGLKEAIRPFCPVPTQGLQTHAPRHRVPYVACPRCLQLRFSYVVGVRRSSPLPRVNQASLPSVNLRTHAIGGLTELNSLSTKSTGRRPGDPPSPATNRGWEPGNLWRLVVKRPSQIDRLCHVGSYVAVSAKTPHPEVVANGLNHTLPEQASGATLAQIANPLGDKIPK